MTGSSLTATGVSFTGDILLGFFSLLVDLFL